MLKFKPVYLVALTALLTGALVVPASAGLLDKLIPRRAAKKTAAAPSVRRAQSPQFDAATYSQNSYTERSSQYQPVSYSVDTPWYNSGSTSYESDCCDCGPEDKHCWHTRHFRRACDQTYYYPVPPYCYACYGTYPTCWSRMQECQVCPQVRYSTRPAPRQGVAQPSRGDLPPPAPPAMMESQPPAAEPPPDLPGKATRRNTAPQTRMGMNDRAPAARSRWTGFADTVIEYGEVSEIPPDTLEEQIAVEDAEEAADEAEPQQ